MSAIGSPLPAREDVERSMAAGDIATALAGSAALLDADPGNGEVIALRAAALLASGQAAAAVDVLAPVACAPDAPYPITSGLAICQAAAGDLVVARESFQRALATCPDEFSLRLVYSDCLAQLGDVDAALPEAFRAINDAQNRGRWLNDATTAPAMRERVRRAMARVDRGREALFDRVLEPHLKAFGHDAMKRVVAGLGVYLGTMAPISPDPRQKPKFFWIPGLPATALYPAARFAWYDALQASTARIREELDVLLRTGQPLTPFLQVNDREEEDSYLGGDPDGRAWDAYFFHRHGDALTEHLSACPATAAALKQVPLTRISGHAPEVLFSVLAPQTHIKPHHGVTNTRVVTHLPLLIPQGDCKLVVGGLAHAWQEGRCVTFDDTFLHEAWNRTDQQRVVLILDTWNPDMTPEECIAVRELVESIGDFNTRAGVG